MGAKALGGDMISILTDSKEVKVEERGRDAYWK
jgi:hypothetical protein